MTAGAMLVEWVGVVATRIASVMADLLPITAGMAAVCTGLYFFSSQVCNQGTPWWRNRGLVTDAWYWLIIPFVAPIIRMSLLIGVAMLMLPFSTEADIKNYVEKGFGPLGALPFWGQVAAYLVISDFLLYWIHRIFHGATMWRFHVIHHSAEDIDWTTAYRFHPVNLCLGPFLMDVLLLYAGVSPKVLIAMAPFQTVTALFVHANLNWTFGPLKYVIATPVFHRWHHTPLDQGGMKNFAPAFSLWDVLFGTFYMPQAALPERYGVDDPRIPQGFFAQLIYPFTGNARPADSAPAGVSASPSALGSAQPQRGS